MMRQLQLKFLMLVFIAGIGLLPGTPSSGSENMQQASDEVNAYEAVIHYKITQFTKDRKWRKFYLAIGLTDPHPPNEELMERFAADKASVLAFQKSDYDVERMRTEGGLVLGVYNFKRTGAIESEVEGYDFLVVGEAEGYRCTLSKRGNLWQVKSCQGTWVA
jgi:hypothetical protein